MPHTAYAEEGEERDWKHITRNPRLHRSAACYTDATRKRSTKSLRQSPTGSHRTIIERTAQSDASISSQLIPNQHSTHPSSPKFIPVIRRRNPSTREIPSEFRAGRIFFRSSQNLSEQAVLPSLEFTKPSSEEAEQDRSRSGSFKRITPSDPSGSTTVTYTPDLSSSPTQDHDHSLTNGCSILSRISEPFNSMLSPSNACIPLRRPPSSHSLVYRINVGVLKKSSAKSTHPKSTPLQPIPAPKSQSARKSISMTFNLRHVPKFLNQRAKVPDFVTDHDKLATPPTQSEVQAIRPILSHPGPPELPPTWRSLISPDGFLRLEQRFGALEMKRQELIWELCRTEHAYVKSLKMIIKIFLQPLKKDQLTETSCRTWSHFVPHPIINLSENLEEICKLHEEIYRSILKNQEANCLRNESLMHSNHQSADSDDHLVILRISETFQNFVDRFKLYQNYLIHFESVHHLIDQHTKDPNSQFGVFLRARSQLEECGKMSFNSFLLRPVQRLMKYPLFFKQLCDVTPVLHADHMAGQQLWKSTDETIKEMQQVKIHEEELAMMKSIEGRIVGLAGSFDLANGERKLVRQGFVRPVYAARYITEKEGPTSDDDDHNHPTDSGRRATVSSSYRKSSSKTVAVSKHLRSRSELSDEWSFSDHTTLRSNVKSAFSPSPDISNTQRLSKLSNASTKSSNTNPEYSPLRPKSHRHHRAPMPPRRSQQASPSLPVLSSPAGKSNVIISRPMPLLPLPSITTVPMAKMTLNPKSSLMSNDLQVDPQATHHASDGRPDLLPAQANRKPKARPSSSSLSSSSHGLRRGWSGKGSLTGGRRKAEQILGIDSDQYKGEGVEESLYLFLFSDGLLLFTRPLGHLVDHQSLKRGNPDHPQLFSLVAQPFALATLLGFRLLLPSVLLPHLQHRARLSTSSSSSFHPHPELRRSEFEMENKETRSEASGCEGSGKDRRRQSKPKSRPVKRASDGCVELQLLRVGQSKDDNSLCEDGDEVVTLSLGLPASPPASITPFALYSIPQHQPHKASPGHLGPHKRAHHSSLLHCSNPHLSVNLPELIHLFILMVFP
ncbi:hypothetical protein VP01_1471g3 [Puccinia sorghi]|uniref:DH domain-containing protein n=1 Tax=Puccinia sorghi TaxID=27349 RepID=A0A0L6VJU9_9BASI|nr:hypothetical protein VP01_1471g3 [Puccinia sorghi]